MGKFKNKEIEKIIWKATGFLVIWVGQNAMYPELFFVTTWAFGSSTDLVNKVWVNSQYGTSYLDLDLVDYFFKQIRVVRHFPRHKNVILMLWDLTQATWHLHWCNHLFELIFFISIVSHVIVQFIDCIQLKQLAFFLKGTPVFLLVSN